MSPKSTLGSKWVDWSYLQKYILLVLRQGFSVVLEPVMELAPVDHLQGFMSSKD